MWLTRLCLQRPVLLVSLLAAVVALGLLVWTKLSVDLFPPDNTTIVTITTLYPGAGPDTVDSLVTQKIEDAVSGMNDLDYVASTSVEGLSNIAVVFTDQAPSESPLEVERRVNSIRSELPPDVQAPVFGKYDPTSAPILSLAVTGGSDLDELQQLADTRIRRQIEAVPGVGQVTLVGGRQREIEIQVDADRLQARGLSLLQVNQALAADNLNVPAGSLVQNGKDWTVRLDAQLATADQLRSVMVASTPLGSVRLQDVANVVETDKPATTIQRTNGRPSIGLTVIKQSDANAVAAADGIKQALTALRPQLPPDVTVSVVSDSSVFTRGSITDVQRELGSAIILTGLILLVFLHTLRSTFIVLLSIPTSLIATLIVMYVLGFSLNMMSLMGLTLTVGILVDDSIVVLENIFRHLQLGEAPVEAAMNGRSEIGLAAIAITLVDVVVFTPIAFMTGTVGQYSRQFGLVVATATLFSLFISFTLTPLLASRWYRATDLHRNGSAAPPRGWQARLGACWDAGYARLAYAYGRLLAGALRFRWPVIATGVVAFVLGVGLLRVGLLKTEFMPNADNNEMLISIEMEPGTALDGTDAAAQTVEDELLRWPEVTQVYSQVGVGASAGGNVTLNRARLATIQVELVPKSQRTRGVDELAAAARAFGQSVPGATVRASGVGLLGGSGAGALQVRIQGDDSDTLAALASHLAGQVRSIPGVADVSDGGVVGQPEVTLQFDRDSATDLGLSPLQVAGVLRTALTGNVASQFRSDNGTSEDITVLLEPSQRATPDDITSMPIITPRGTTIQLGQLAQVHTSTGPTQVTRRDRQRIVYVTATADGTRALGDIARDVQTTINGMNVPAGYSVIQGGAVENQNQSFSQIGQALIVSVLLMYLLLVALYESALYPLVIMLSLPLGVVGAFGLLAATGNTLNVMSMIGLILLTGLIGKNAILLVDFTNTLRKRGLPRTEALLQAGPARLRPILMTTAALLLAMLPIALRLGEGSEWRAPMAVCLIGGLLTSTLLTLVFIPAVYTVVDDLQTGLRALPTWYWRRRAHRETARLLVQRSSVNGSAHGESEAVSTEADLPQRR